jgi:hypothetical protein
MELRAKLDGRAPAGGDEITLGLASLEAYDCVYLGAKFVVGSPRQITLIACRLRTASLDHIDGAQNSIRLLFG